MRMAEFSSKNKNKRPERRRRRNVHCAAYLFFFGGATNYAEVVRQLDVTRKQQKERKRAESVAMAVETSFTNRRKI